MTLVRSTASRWRYFVAVNLAIFGLGAVMMAATPAVAQVHVERSVQFIEDLSTDTIALLKNESLTDEERRDRFYALFVDRFAVNTIGRFLLGRSWRTASEAERREYMALFQDVTVNQWSSLVSENFTGQTISVMRAINVDTPNPRQKAALVRTEILDGDDVLALVDWTVASVGDVYKITDVTVSGVSLLTTQRDEFEQILRTNNGNVSALNALLRQRREETAQTAN